MALRRVGRCRLASPTRDEVDGILPVAFLPLPEGRAGDVIGEVRDKLAPRIAEEVARAEDCILSPALLLLRAGVTVEVRDIFASGVAEEVTVVRKEVCILPPALLLRVRDDGPVRGWACGWSI